jgi:deoxycitidine kinase
VQFFERSVYSDRYCFALNCYDSGLFSDTEYACYTDWHTWLLTAFPQLELDGFIYLRVDPKVCMKRLEKRNRSEEGSVKLDYLESVHLRHEEWLIEKLPSDPVAISVRNTKMLIINADEEFETNPARQAEMLRQIREFIAQL